MRDLRAAVEDAQAKVEMAARGWDRRPEDARGRGFVAGWLDLLGEHVAPPLSRQWPPGLGRTQAPREHQQMAFVADEVDVVADGHSERFTFVFEDALTRVMEDARQLARGLV